jgi:hypothetical protein
MCNRPKQVKTIQYVSIYSSTQQGYQAVLDMFNAIQMQKMVFNSNFVLPDTSYNVLGRYIFVCKSYFTTLKVIQSKVALYIFLA